MVSVGAARVRRRCRLCAHVRCSSSLHLCSPCARSSQPDQPALSSCGVCALCVRRPGAQSGPSLSASRSTAPTRADSSSRRRTSASSGTRSYRAPLWCAQRPSRPALVTHGVHAAACQGGFAAGWLWTAQGVFFARSAQLLADACRLERAVRYTCFRADHSGL